MGRVVRHPSRVTLLLEAQTRVVHNSKLFAAKVIHSRLRGVIPGRLSSPPMNNFGTPIRAGVRGNDTSEPPRALDPAQSVAAFTVRNPESSENPAHPRMSGGAIRNRKSLDQLPLRAGAGAGGEVSGKSLVLDYSDTSPPAPAPAR